MLSESRVFGVETGVEGDQVVHAEDTVDVARVETEEDTTEGGEGTHEVGLEGDGGFDAACVGRSDEAYTSSRHDGGFVARRLGAMRLDKWAE